MYRQFLSILKILTQNHCIENFLLFVIHIHLQNLTFHTHTTLSNFGNKNFTQNRRIFENDFKGKNLSITQKQDSCSCL